MIGLQFISKSELKLAASDGFIASSGGSDISETMRRKLCVKIENLRLTSATSFPDGFISTDSRATCDLSNKSFEDVVCSSEKKFNKPD